MNLIKKLLKGILIGLLIVTTLVVGLITIVLLTSQPKEEKALNLSNLPVKVNKSLDKSKYKLSPLDLNDRIIYIYGEINGENSPGIAQQILRMGDSPKPIYIFINSPGGSILYGSMIVSAMEAVKGPINTVCIELCASMAAMIHQYGTNRFMLNKSILMFHPASGGVGDGELDKAYSQLTFFKRFIAKMEENAAVKSKISYETYKYLSGTELWMDSEDSLNSNFADKVVYIRGSDAQKIFYNPPSVSSDKIHLNINSALEKFDIIWE